MSNAGLNGAVAVYKISDIIGILLIPDIKVTCKILNSKNAMQLYYLRFSFPFAC